MNNSVLSAIGVGVFVMIVVVLGLSLAGIIPGAIGDIVIITVALAIGIYIYIRGRRGKNV